MAVELRVPQVGESITEVEIGEWLKSEGDRADKDENVVVIETDKVTFELPAPVAGTVTKVLKQKGEPAAVGEVIGYMEAGKAAGERAQEATAKQGEQLEERKEEKEIRRQGEKEIKETGREDGKDAEAKPSKTPAKPRVMPAALRALAEHGLRPEEVTATGPGGRLLKEDVLRHLELPRDDREKEPPEIKAPPRAPEAPATRDEEAVPMNPMRRRIAQRLVEAQQRAALLSTFNEIDMSAVDALREKHQARFQEKYRTKLGLMSFFVKAAIDALKSIPQVNAEIRGDNIVYHNYYDIGVAVGGGRGLVVPVLRNAERMSFAEIELAIADLAHRAQENKLKLEELEGGTFTISNGGIYGSLLSTPIVNPPQSAILGMHAIQERPVAREGVIVIRPMMYVALTYDHRIIDGREAVTFLRRIKEAIEDPARILLEV
jgi:2-oxoglutarate dehydrogenase E2 component (dihydrolipoamide succinyltransferase)